MDFRNRNSRDIDFRNTKDVDFRSGQYGNTSQSSSIPFGGNMRSGPFHVSNRHADRYSPSNDLPIRSKNFDECSMESMEKTHDDFDDFNMDIVQYPIDKIRMARNALNVLDNTRDRLENIMRSNDRSDQPPRSQRRSPDRRNRRSRSRTRRKRSPSPKSVRRDRNVELDRRTNRTQRARSPRQERNAEFNDCSHVQNQPSNSKQDERRMNSMPMMNPMLTPNFQSVPNDFNRSAADFQVAPNLSQVNLSQMTPNLTQAVPNLQMMVANLSQMIAVSITQSVAQGTTPQLANGIAQLMGVNNVPSTNNPMQDWSDPGSLNPPVTGFQGSMTNSWMNYPAPDINQQYPEFSRINESMVSHNESFRGSEPLLTQRRSPLRRSPEPRSQSPRRRNRSPIRLNRSSRSPLRRNRSPLNRRMSPFNSGLRSPISPRNFTSRPRSPLNSRRSRSRSPLNSRVRSPRQRLNSRNRSPRSPLNSRKRSPLNPRQRSRQNSRNKSPLNPRRLQPTQSPLSEQKPPVSQNLTKPHARLRKQRHRQRNLSNKGSPRTSESRNSPSRMPPQPAMSPNAILSKMAETVKAVEAMSNSLSRPAEIRNQPRIQPRNIPHQQNKIPNQQPKPRIQPCNIPHQQNKIPNQQPKPRIQPCNIPHQQNKIPNQKFNNCAPRLTRKEKKNLKLQRKIANRLLGEGITDRNTQPKDNLTFGVSH